MTTRHLFDREAKLTPVSSCSKISTGHKDSLDHIIKRTVLRDCNENRLMVRSSIDSRHPINTLRQPALDGRRELAVLRNRVQAGEERELVGVRRLGLVEARDLLDDDVRVAEDKTRGRVDLLGRGEEVRVGVHEPARLEVLDCEHDREVCVRRNGAEVRRADELGRGHRGCRRNHTHGRAIARSALDLRAVRKRKVDCSAEVDEVVRRGC